MQGEDARCAVPWKGATRRLMSRGRLCHAKARGRESPVPRAAASNLAVRHQPRSERRPLSQGAASPLGGPDKPTSGPFDDRLGRGREDRLRRTDRRLRAGAGSKDPSPSGRPGLQRPEDPSSAAPGFRRDPGAAGSLEALEGASTARVGPPLPRRERAALLAERDGGAQARRPSEPATGARSGPEPATTAGPRSLGRDRRPRGAALSVGEPAGPKPDGPTALAGTPALSRGK